MRRWGYLGAFLAGVATTLLVGAADPYAGLELYARVLSDIDTHAAEPPDLLRVVYASLGGVTDALDEHSAWYPPEEWARVRARDSGLRLGIGATLVAEPCGLRVTALEPWGPAEKVGLRVGDCVFGTDPAAFDGPEGDVVQLSAERDGAVKSYALLRAVAREPALQVHLHGDIAYIRVAHFHDAIVEPLARQVPTRPAPRAFVLDLRHNPGGAIDEAARLVDRFVSDGLIVTVSQRAAGERSVTATQARSDWAQPLVVLVDGETASAAEIAAGALRDLGRAPLVGTRSFGKGSVQNVFQYADGSALKLTVGHYLLPRGERVGAGLEPDQVVESTPDFHAPFAERLPKDAALVAALARLGAAPR